MCLISCPNIKMRAFCFFVFFITEPLYLNPIPAGVLENQDMLGGVNPIPAGVLENQDMLGGVNLTPPPSKSHVLCPNMTNDTSLESFCALLLESAKEFENMQKLNFLIAKSSYIEKMFAKKNLSKK